MNGVEDLLGRRIAIGDRVAASFRSSNAAILRVGTVLDFGERGNSLTVRIRWEHGSDHFRSPKRRIEKPFEGEIYAELFRFVRLEP